MRQPGDLAAHAVEAREHDGFGSVVDDEVDAGQVLEGADVAALAADDATLHVVGRQRHDRDGRLGDVVGGGPLDRDRQDVARPAVGFALGFVFDGAHHAGHVVAGLLLGLAQQHLLGLGAGQARDAFEHRGLLRMGGLELFGQRRRLLFALEELLVASFELGGTLLDLLLALRHAILRAL